MDTKAIGAAAADAAAEECRQLSWERLDGTAGLVADMRKGERPDTRPFLRPIFRWCKHIVGRDQDARGIQRSLQSADATSRARWLARPKFLRALALSEYVARLKVEGDGERSIPAQPQLQPIYCYNTLITMSQVCTATRVKFGHTAIGHPPHANHQPPVTTTAPRSAPAWPSRLARRTGACCTTASGPTCLP